MVPEDRSRFSIVFWDFDGTLIPFDSEQFLLESLFLQPVRRSLRSLGARLFVYGDRHGWDPGLIKVIYGRCLRGIPFSALEGVCVRIAAHISEADRAAIRALAARVEMVLLSCGTADLSRGTLRAAGLADVFSRVEANRLTRRKGRIAGIERRIYLPQTKVEIAASYGVSWERVIAVGDGLTDLPLLDHAGLPVLIAAGARADRFAGRGYHVVPLLGEAIALIAESVS